MRRFYKTIIVVFLLGVHLGFVPWNAQAQTYVFGTASYAAPGIVSGSPSAALQMITADFNGDGIPDLAVLGSTSQSSQVISIFLGKPDGTFAPRVDYPVQASGFTVGDFNGDGVLDIVVVSNIYLPVANILVGNGDGSFQSPVPLNQSIPNGTYSAAASADFNGDGKLDLLFLSPNFGTGATMMVLFGNGNGTFGTPVTYQVPVAPYLSIGDLNGDGRPDIVIAGPDYTSGQPNLISVLINNGNGTFQNPVNYSVTGIIEALAVADLNGDGKLDLVVPTGGASAAVSVLLGIGDGTFASPVTYTSNLLSIYAGSVAVADFNGDGKLDIAITPSNATPLATTGVAILLGNGDGTFESSPLLYSAGLDPAAVIALDVNGDGKPDLVVLGGYFVGPYYSVTVLINQGEGTFPKSSTFPVPQYAYSAVAGDFNGDNRPDIAVDSFNSPGGVSVLLGNGDGTFQAHLDTAVGEYLSVMAAGDFNGDGRLDLVVAGSLTPNTEAFFTLLGNGDGTFQSPLSQTTSSIVDSLAVGDFNGDGKLDVAAVIDGTNAVSIFLGSGNGTFAVPVQYATGPMLGSPPYHNILVGDFNQDGILDLAVSTDSGVSILLGKGDGTFMPYTAILPGERLLALGDFNGDSKPDLAIVTGGMLISVALGNGGGTFQQASGYQLTSVLNAQSSVVGDFNKDGKLDIAFANQSTNVMTVLLGNGDGTFSTHIEYAAGGISNNLDFLVANDFNGDGALDLALANSSTVSVFLSSQVLALYPSRLNFAGQPIGTPSPAQTVSMSNPSPVPIFFGAIGVPSFLTLGDFSETNNCDSKLMPGSNCHADVTFTPSLGGPSTGFLHIFDSASPGVQTVVLAGTGTAPAVELIPPGLGFADQGIGTTSPAKSTTLTNTGTAALTIASIAENGDFAQTNTCGGSVNAGANCIIYVTFTPTTSGARSGSITVTDNAGDSPQTVSLTGTGTGPVVSLSSPLSFSPQLVGTTSSSQTVTLRNTGNANHSFTAIGATGPFAIANSGTTCSTSNPVAASGTCTVALTFTPTAGGTASGSLSFTDNAPSSPQTVTLTGTGEDFSITMPSGSSSSATVTPGQTANYSLNLSGLGGLSQTINFICQGPPSGATCSVNPPSATPSASGTVALTVTVTTTASSEVLPNSRRVPPLGSGRDVRIVAWLLLGLLALAGGARGLVVRRPQTKALRLGLGMAALAMLALALAACGGGGGGGGTVQNHGTPAGTYTLTVTGTASGSPSLQHSMNLTLTVG